MIIDKAKLQPLLWAVVGAWKAGDQDLHLRTDALDEFLGESTVEEVALGLLEEIQTRKLGDRHLREALSKLRSRNDNLKAENEALRKRLEGLVHVSDATGWEKHTCGEIARAKALLGMEVRHG